METLILPGISILAHKFFLDLLVRFPAKLNDLENP